MHVQKDVISARERAVNRLGWMEKDDIYHRKAHLQKNQH